MIASLLRTRRFWLIFLVTALSVLLLGWVAWHNRHMLNADGVAYISIAQHYLAADWHGALNAYWSPLLSWLMVPLLGLGFTGQEAFVVVNFLTGSFILLFGSWLCWRLTRDGRVVALYFACILPFMLYLMTAQITPDVLVIAWVLIAVVVFFFIGQRLESALSRQQLAWYTGSLALLGFTGFLTKVYLQPVFIVALLLFVSIFIWRQRIAGKTLQLLLRQSVILLLATVGLYALLCLFWVIPLSLKYGQFTISSSYAFNNGQRDLPQTRLLLPPPHDTALTAWEDPTYLAEHKLSAEDTGGSAHPLIARLKSVYHSLPLFMQNVGLLWVFIYMPVIAAVAYLATRRKLYTKLDHFLIYGMMLFAVYFGGYAATGGIGNERYLWPLLALSILLAALLSSFLWRAVAASRQRQLAMSLLLLCLPATLWMRYAQYPHHYIMASNPPPAQVITEKAMPHPPIALQEAAQRIKESQIVPPDSRLAGSDFATATFMAYFLEVPSYGTIPPGTSLKDAVNQRQLAQHGVDYYIDIASPGQKISRQAGKIIYSHDLPNYCQGACTLYLVDLR